MRRLRRARAACLLSLFALGAACQSAEVSRAVGARCEEKAECDERCQPPSASFPGGFCTLSCLGDGDCPGETRCVDVAGGICLFSCGGDEDCGFLGEAWACGEEEAIPAGDERVSVCLGSQG